MNVRHVPNLVTFSRLILAVVAFVFLQRLVDAGSREDASASMSAAFAAFWFYLLAGITDFLDGWLARRYGWVTALGRVADPVVDKVLTLGGMIYLAAAPAMTTSRDLIEVMPVWAVVLVLAREFLVTAIRGLVESRGMEFPADRFGKLKMILQTIYLCVLLGAAGAVPSAIGLPFLIHLRHPALVAAMFWAVIGLTAYSGANYSLKAARMLARVEW